MGKIPQIDSIEDLAKFRDTHDITDFEDEFEEVETPILEKDQKTSRLKMVDRRKRRTRRSD